MIGGVFCQLEQKMINSLYTYIDLQGISAYTQISMCSMKWAAKLPKELDPMYLVINPPVGCFPLVWIPLHEFRVNILLPNTHRDTQELKCYTADKLLTVLIISHLRDIFLTGLRDTPYATAQLTTARLVFVMGLGAQPCITRLALLQGYDTSTDPLRSELLWCLVGVAAKEIKRAMEGKDIRVP